MTKAEKALMKIMGVNRLVKVKKTELYPAYAMVDGRAPPFLPKKKRTGIKPRYAKYLKNANVLRGKPMKLNANMLIMPPHHVKVVEPKAALKASAKNRLALAGLGSGKRSGNTAKARGMLARARPAQFKTPKVPSPKAKTITGAKATASRAKKAFLKIVHEAIDIHQQAIKFTQNVAAAKKPTKKQQAQVMAMKKKADAAYKKARVAEVKLDKARSHLEKLEKEEMKNFIVSNNHNVNVGKIRAMATGLARGQSGLMNKNDMAYMQNMIKMNEVEKAVAKASKMRKAEKAKARPKKTTQAKKASSSNSTPIAFNDIFDNAGKKASTKKLPSRKASVQKSPSKKASVKKKEPRGFWGALWAGANNEPSKKATGKKSGFSSGL